jgi:predicted nucleic acid-binding protein
MTSFAVSETNGMTEAALQERVYLDTNVFIRAFEGSPDEAKAFQEFFIALRQNRSYSVTSELTLAELLAPADRKEAVPLHIKRRFYLNLIVWSGFIDLQPVTRSILCETADLRQVAKHKLPDAIHIVTAIRAGCTLFMSSDGDAKRLPKSMTRLQPDKQGIQRVLDAFHI